jgi:CheY-like chemotaxis protein
MDELKVLIADDEPDAQARWERLLRPRGLFVFTVTAGVEVIKAAVAKQPDAVVLDLDSNERAFELAQVLRDRGQTQHIPVVAVTARPHAALVQRALQNGIQAIFIKPYDPDAFTAEIARLCGAAAARRVSGRNPQPGYVIVRTSMSAGDRAAG